MVVRIIVSMEKRAVKKGNWDNGFTLWEIIVVVFLMGVILTLATPHFGTAMNQVLIRVDLANKARIEGAAQLYRIDTRTYPLSVTDLIHTPMGVSGWRGPYLDEIPINPFDSAQIYKINTSGQVN